MLAPSKNLIASALALVAAASVVNGHGYMSDPAVTFLSTAGDPTQFIATIESTASGFSGTFNSDPATNTASFTTAFASSKYSSLKEMVTDLGQLISTTGVTITCGLTDPDETAQPLPETYVEWAHSSSEGFTASHEGPCEIWCDDTRVFQDDDCAADYTTAPAQLPYDRDACLGSSQLTFYWLALHSSTWQVYINCAALESTSSTGATSKYAVGSSSTSASSTASSNSTSTATTAPATTTSAPAATTSAPAATTSAPTTDVSADGSDDSDCGSLDIAGDYDDDSDCGSLDLAGSDDSDCGSLDLAGSDDSDCGSLDLAGSDDGDVGNEADDASFSLDDSTPEPSSTTSTSTSTSTSGNTSTGTSNKSSGNKGSSTSTSTTTTTTTNNSGTSNTSSGTSTSTGTNTASDEVAGDADTATVEDDSDCGSLDLAGSDDDSDCGSLDLAGSDDSDCGSLDLAGSDDSDCGSLDLAGSDDENYTGSTTGINFNTVPLEGSSAGTVEPEA